MRAHLVSVLRRYRAGALVRLAAVAPMAAAAVGTMLLRPGRSTELLAVATVGAALVGGLVPASVAPAAAMGLAIADDLVATGPLGTAGRAAVSALVAALLLASHLAYSLAGEVPLRATIERRAVVGWARSGGLLLAGSLPIVVVLSAVGPLVRPYGAVRVVGAVALMALALLPLALARRGARR